jgi:predicted amidohydrolase YtcJ
MHPTTLARCIEACEKPCSCGSGEWPCHVNGDEAIAIVLDIVKDSYKDKDAKG